jgi:hypothetical protein
MFSIMQRNTDFYTNFSVHLLFEFFVVLDYDEMNFFFFFGVFIMYFEVHIFSICNNYEFDVTMNYSIKFVET